MVKVMYLIKESGLSGKRLFLLSLSAIISMCCIAQNTLDFTVKQSHKVIVPTLKNLRTLVDCSSDQFSVLMKQYGYWQSKDIEASDYTHLIYENNSLDFYMDGGDGEGCNYIEMSEVYKHAHIFGKISNVLPVNALINLRKELTPYFRDKTSDGIERFVVEDGKGGGYLVQIYINNKTHYNIHIQHFSKLHN